MAIKTIVHKGYHGTIKVDNSDYSLSGSILFLDEEVSYKGETFEEVEKNFQEAVDAHIKSCIERGIEPPFSE